MHKRKRPPPTRRPWAQQRHSPGSLATRRCYKERLDNVTHSLIGYALGRALGDRALPGAPADEQPRTRLASVLTSVLASNVPDLDFVVGPLAHDAKLAYLLHHRGHTHTLVVALPIGVLLALGCAWLCGARSKDARRRVLWAGVLGALLHVGFDGLNDYGVHPFFPLDDRWYYGDAVFIIEPLLLAALLPLLVLHGATRAGRVIGALLALALLALVWLPAMVPAPTAFATSGALVLALGLQWRLGTRAWPALAGAGLVVLVFGSASALAKAAVRAELSRARPSESVAQLVATPLPANPLCWSTLAVSLDAAGVYRVRVGAASLWPRLAPLEGCRFRSRERTTAPLAPAVLAGEDGRVRFEQVFEASIESLRALRRQRCDADAGLRFMRAPFWTEQGGVSVLGDLRYDREPELGFAELALGGRCEDPLPPWVPPLSSWLR